MIRTVIIDDEPLAVDALDLLLKKRCKDMVDVIATSTSPGEGKKLIQKLYPDLVFLDVQMPGMSGLDLVRSFGNQTFRVVFVTAFDSYAIEAFRISAIDYLLKPVEEDEILRVVQKIKKDIEKNQSSVGSQRQHIEELLIQNNFAGEPRIGIFMAEKIVFINVDDIIYCEANGSYTNLYFYDGRKIVASKSLSDFELQLSSHNFFRIHRSYLINLNRVKEFQRNDGGCVLMENGMQLEVSQRKRKEFVDAIDHFII